MDRSIFLSLFLSTPPTTVTITPTERTVVEGENAIFACSPLIPAASPFLSTIDPGSDQAEALIDDLRLDFIDYPNGDPAPNRTFIWLDTDREENGRRFFCTIGDVTTAVSTLYIHSECYQYCKCHFSRWAFILSLHTDDLYRDRRYVSIMLDGV